MAAAAPAVLLEQILPDTVLAVETREDAVEGDLFPDEEALLARSLEKRRREFATGRACARAALRRLGRPSGAIVVGPHGAPAWPSGVVGSITHCEGYRAAAVAFERDVLTLGVDAEPNAPLPEGVLDLVALPDERDWVLERVTASPDVRWDRLLFSAKEAVYKAWFPVARRWLDFTDARVTVDAAGRSFEARVHAEAKPRSLARLSGRWVARDGLIVTAVAVTRDARGAAGSPRV